MSFLGVDLGSTGVRAAVFSDAGELIAAASRRTSLHRHDGHVRLPIGAYAQALETCIRQAAGLAASRGLPVAAVAMSCQGETVLPVGPDGGALDDAVLGMDVRGAEAARRLGERVGERRVHDITGQPLHPMFSVHKIASMGGRWLEAYGFRCLPDFFAQSWGLGPVLDWAGAARTGAFDVDRRSWSDELLTAVAVDAPWLDSARFSACVPSGTPIGELPADTRERLGLAAGTLLVSGTHDQAATFLGVGSRPVVSFGSSDCVTVGSAGRVAHPAGRGFADYPITSDLWITLAGTAAGGWTLEWYASLLEGGAAELPGLLETMSPDPAVAMMLPYLAGSSTLDNDPSARGAILALGLDTDRPELTRAVIEAAGYELRRVVDALEESGVRLDVLRAAGGGGDDTGTLQARSDASGIGLLPVGGDAAVRGAAMLAAAAVGATVPPVAAGDPVSPRPRWVDWHRTRRAIYEDAGRELGRITRRLAALATPTLEEIHP